MRLTLKRREYAQLSASLSSRVLDSFVLHQSHYWVGFVSDPVTAILFLFWDTAILRRNVYSSIVSYVIGIFCVSLCEYALHRWIFHGGRSLAQAGHLLHHDLPKDLLGWPWFLTAGFWWFLAYVAVGWLQIPLALSFLAGFISGYALYGVLHHLLHHQDARTRWFRKLRNHHRIHHRFSDVNFGVTNRFWDKAFGTLYHRQKNPKRVRSL